MENKTITISAIEQKTLGNGSVVSKIKDERNLTYTMFHEWQGNPTVPYTKINSLPNKGMNQTVKIMFKSQEVNGQNGTYTSRTITDIDAATQPEKNLSMVKGNIDAKGDDEKWEKINFGKCKHQFLIEMYKKGDAPSPETESEAEKWAVMSMRVTNTGNMALGRQKATQTPNPVQNVTETPNLDDNDVIDIDVPTDNMPPF